MAPEPDDLPVRASQPYSCEPTRYLRDAIERKYLKGSAHIVCILQIARLEVIDLSITKVSCCAHERLIDALLEVCELRLNLVFPLQQLGDLLGGGSPGSEEGDLL